MNKKKIAVKLTTIDNPFDPVTQWVDWKRFDEDHGYFSNAYLARIAKTSIELSDSDYLLAVESAIDEICMLDLTGLYKKVTVFADN